MLINTSSSSCQSQHSQQMAQQQSPNGSDSSSSNQSNSSASCTPPGEMEDTTANSRSMPKYNFRALLRKTGKDLTSGQTLSKKRDELAAETNQIDFRNVLHNKQRQSQLPNNNNNNNNNSSNEKRNSNNSNKVHIDEQVKLIQRLVTTH
jgi:hypothetical protein